MTIKEILAENRESIISSIKWIFKVWNPEDVKLKMIEFLAFCEKNMNPEEFAKSKRIKSDLKWLVARMKSSQEREYNLKRFGIERPKLADIVAGLNLIEEDNGNVYHPIYKTFVKNEGYNPIMQK